MGAEIRTCNSFLAHELKAMPDESIVVALGTIAHNAVLRALSQKLSAFKFGHNVVHQPEKGITLIDSYHCSRYNTQTRRLTPKMFEQVFQRAAQLLT